MLKKSLLYITAFAVIALLIGCGETFQIISDGVPSRSLNNYNNIHIGWIDLNESNWKKYEYENASLWKATIQDMNVHGIQAYMKKFLPDKKYTGPNSNTDSLPIDNGLYIKFNVKEIQRNYSKTWGGADYLFVDVSFIDIKSKKTILMSSVKAASSSGPGHQWAFEGRLSNTLYNLASFISTKI